MIAENVKEKYNEVSSAVQDGPTEIDQTAIKQELMKKLMR